MRQLTHTLHLKTKGKGLYVFTESVVDWVRELKINSGLLTLFIRHTSASLPIQENDDPDVQGDLERFLARLVPEGDAIYRHTLEGPDDMPAHVRSALTQTQLAIPIASGCPVLGTWQGIYLWEHRHVAQQRQVVLHVIGE